MTERQNNNNNFENAETNQMWSNKDEEGVVSGARRQTNKFLTENIIGKLTIMSLAGIVLFTFRLYGIPQNDVHCIVDEAHNFMNPVNLFLNNQVVYANFLIVSSSFMMDCFSLSIFVYWLLFIRNLRFMLTVTLFYVIRSIHMLVFHLRFPIGYYWNDPHFLSLTVPYGRTSDFFFSGHCGFLAICYFEWRSLGWPRVQFTVLIGGIYLAFILLALKAHYIIDISTGVMLAHYFHIISQHYHERVEKSLYKAQIYVFGFLGWTTLKENLEKEAEIYSNNSSSHANDNHQANLNQQFKEDNSDLPPSQRGLQK